MTNPPYTRFDNSSGGHQINLKHIFVDMTTAA